ncbi:MAG: sensor histidine kinase [Candidatus Thorarchaeota archaeon]
MRDAQDIQSRVKHILERMLDIPRILTRPAPSIAEGGQRRRARFLRFALLTGVCAFPILQITSEMILGYPLYLILTVIAAGIYLLSGTSHLRLASALTIILTACIPFISIPVYPLWSMGDLAMQILTWPVLSILLGTQLISIKKQSLLVGGMSTALLLLSLSHPGIFIQDAVELIAVYLAISIFLMFTSWNQDYYSTGLERSNRTLEARRKELEIYTSLLRHDLGNDIQMILGGIELSQVSAGEYKQKAYLESTLAAAERMRSLLQMFSLTESELNTDIVTVLEKISQRAEIAFKGMLVSVEASDSVRRNPPRYGRLVALAFENLLRNSAQHAGDHPSVEISLSQSGDTLEVLFGDDGPGIDPEILEELFEKGITTGDKGKGLGLYLTKTIIESENGSIELLNRENPGCYFLIKLPFINGP